MTYSQHDLTIAGYDPYLHSADYYYDPVAAERPILFAEKYLTHVKGEKGGKKFLLLPYQKIVTRNLFGWKHKITHFRRYRTLFLTSGRKSGKSFYCSLLLWYMTACDGEQGAESVIAANSADQAGKLFSVLEAQHQRFPQNIRNKFKVAGHKKILYRATNSTIAVVSATGGSNHGGNIHLAIIDELSWSKKSDIYTALATGQDSRNQPLTVVCSTVSNLTDNKFAEMLTYAESVRDNTLAEPDPTFLPVIFRMPKDADWTDEKNWYLSNPSMNGDEGTPKLSNLRVAFAKARSMPSEENDFRMTKLNQQCDTLQSFVPMGEYNLCPHDDPLPEDLPPAYAAFDLSSNRDVTAFVISWKIGERVYCEPHFWISRKWATKYHQDKNIKYLDWEHQNQNLTICDAGDGNAIDYIKVADDIRGLCEKYYISKILYDRYKHCNVTIDLERSGLECVAVGQDFKSMHTPTTELERLIMTKNLTVVGNNKIMRWMMGNTEVRSSSGLIKPERPDRHKAERKIDGVVALIMTIYGHLSESVYFNSSMILGD